MIYSENLIDSPVSDSDLTVRTCWEKYRFSDRQKIHLQNIKCDGSTMAHVVRCCSDGSC